jgi:DNA modification methylase
MKQTEASTRTPSRTILHADCLSLLERLDNRCVRLVYLDPPWQPKDDFAPSRPKRRKQDQQSEEPPKRDAAFLEYIAWFTRVIQQGHRVALHDGNVVVHAEPLTEGYLRLIVNELLPSAEVVRISLAAPRVYARHDIPVDNQNSLLLVRKSKESVWNPPTRPMMVREIRDRYPNTDSAGRTYFLADLTAPELSSSVPEWNGIRPPSGRTWRFSKERLDQLQQEGRLSISPATRMPRLKVYADEQADIPVGMNWNDISPLLPKKERTGYVAQQPLALLERLIKATTDIGDWVVDPMCGSGTALVAAEMLGRKWIGADLNSEAVTIATARIEGFSGSPVEEPFDLDRLPIRCTTNSLPRSSLCVEQPLRFVLNKPIPLEETRHYEFKEVKGANPVGAIKNTADEYAVAFLNSEGGRILWGVRNEDRSAIGVPLNYRDRDEVAKAIDSTLCRIQPSLPPSSWHLDFFPVYDEDSAIEDLWIVQLVVPRPSDGKVLYGTGSGDAFVKTSSGKKKQSFSELQAEVIRRNEP